VGTPTGMARGLTGHDANPALRLPLDRRAAPLRCRNFLLDIAKPGRVPRTEEIKR
jgi:hypothetical protein